MASNTGGIARSAAYALAALSLAVVGASATELWVGARHGVPIGDDAAYVAVGSVLGLASCVLAVVVGRRRPHNVVAPLLALNGLVACEMVRGDLYQGVAAAVPGVLPGSSLYLTFGAGSWMALYVPAALLMLYFPDGRLPSPRWRPVVVGLIAVPVVFTVLLGFDPAPFEAPFADVEHALPVLPSGVFAVVQGVALAMLPALLGLLIAAAAAMVVRYRSASDPVLRAQVSWFALGSLFLPATLLLCWTSYLLLGDADLVIYGLAATYLAIPVATAIALLRHDLYDVDRALSAAVTYALASAVLLGFYTLASFLAGLAVGGSGAVAAAAATAACAAALAPLRHRLQRRVDAHLYPQRQAALAALEQLRHRTHTGEARPEELESVLRVALRDPVLRVGYQPPGGTELVDSDGAPLGAVADEDTVDIGAGGERIGVLVRGAHTSRELLRELAGASALLVEIVRLRLQLASALRDVDSSRTRLLRASYTERRRLEQDLHDGAQQRLVSLGMALRLAQRHLPSGEVDVDGLLDQSVAELATAVAELRHIAHGLRPSSLDNGLRHALTMLANTVPMPVTVDVQAGELPEHIATTAYYTVSEAMTNVVKHANAAAIELLVEQADGAVRVRISDDGLGGALLRPGAGLAGLADRIAATGGALRIASPSGRGTVVEAVLPCAS